MVRLQNKAKSIYVPMQNYCPVSWPVGPLAAQGRSSQTDGLNITDFIEFFAHRGDVQKPGRRAKRLCILKMDLLDCQLIERIAIS